MAVSPSMFAFSRFTSLSLASLKVRPSYIFISLVFISLTRVRSALWSMYSLAVLACPFSIKNFSTTSWTCSTVGWVSLNSYSRWDTISSAKLSDIFLSFPPTRFAAKYIALVILFLSNATTRPSLLTIFFIILTVLHS